MKNPIMSDEKSSFQRKLQANGNTPKRKGIILDLIILELFNSFLAKYNSKQVTLKYAITVAIAAPVQEYLGIRRIFIITLISAPTHTVLRS